MKEKNRKHNLRKAVLQDIANLFGGEK